ncbi:UDP-glycosyltransferase 89A2-like [Neltuma alba]|uniref:UDP-glycosyltransferase 89A2-like n=1 Tax=Neltuma alba TaxID=207710 RepID=UPI0010A37B7C|nr:UDP-glycosyltransferase 89A2-like [Prosopis alba]
MSKSHVLIFPYPAQGHILALLDLSHQLALRGLSITLIVTPKNLSLLHPLLRLHPVAVHTLILPFPSHPKIPPGVENVRELGNAGNYSMINALSKLQDPIIQWFRSHPSPPVAIISDFFLGWTLKLSVHLGIPRIAFYPGSALLALIINFCWRNTQAVRGQRVIEFSDFPGAPSFKEEHLPSIVRNYRESDPDSEFVKESSLENIVSWGCIFNSFRDLEGEYLEYLRTTLKHPRVFVVGPLSLIGPDSGGDQANQYPDEHSDLFNWLDGCPDGSVLYVCFGSQKFLKREQMAALAAGLERSNTRFIWVVKSGTPQQVEEGYGVVPEGFEDRVSGRGFVIGSWVPQVAILNHRAVGGFLSHCGWNSLSEAIVAGVMILGWPMEADQFVNAKLMVDDKGVAVRVCEGADSVPDPGELGRIVARSMGADSAEKERTKALREKAHRSVSEEGRSGKELDQLVEALTQLNAR